MNNWNYVQWSDETKINVFSSDGVSISGGSLMSTKIMVSRGVSNVVFWGCTSAVGTGELWSTEGKRNSNMY